MTARLVGTSVAVGLALFALALVLRTHAFGLLGPRQWHLGSRGHAPGAANVVAAWPLSRGAGVVVGVVDDGIDATHPDLVESVVAGLSWDFRDDDPDPSPVPSEAHGTAVAGLIGGRQHALTDMSGVAPLAGLAALRLNGRDVVPIDARDARVFEHELDRIDVVANSWAPGFKSRPGDREPAGPGPLAQAAIERAVANGRGGRGRIFVWAAGNRGGEGKDCNLNGYASSRLGIAVGAATDTGEHARYSESCAALFLTAPSNGGRRGLSTTDLAGGAGRSAGDYRGDFGGTSGAAAIASGVVALMLARNPALTWRDVKHILASTAVRVDPDDPGWTSGPLPHNPRYGFGLVDAHAAVSLAARWERVLPEVALPEHRRTLDVRIPDGSSSVTDTIVIPARHAAFRIEHVDVVFTAQHPERGDLEITLTSPAGVTSRLAPAWSRSQGADYRDWRFGSVRHWGESAAGAWWLTVADRVAGASGVWRGWTLRIHGVDGTVSSGKS